MYFDHLFEISSTLRSMSKYHFLKKHLSTMPISFLPSRNTRSTLLFIFRAQALGLIETSDSPYPDQSGNPTSVDVSVLIRTKRKIMEISSLPLLSSTGHGLRTFNERQYLSCLSWSRFRRRSRPRGNSIAHVSQSHYT